MIKGEEKDETIQQLVSVEDPANETEIVIHVNMLKEGWDVTNLYTIVPLRAANSKTLVEQSIGRGLRLPYGKRTGVKAVDRLNIVAHDRFQAIVDEANNPNSIIRTGVVIGRDIPLERKQTVVVQPGIMEKITPSAPAPGETPRQEPLVFTTPAEQAAARIAVEVFKKFEYLPSSRYLTDEEVRKEVLQEVRAAYEVPQLTLIQELSDSDLNEVVDKVTALYIQHSIDIPRIIVQPRGDITYGYRDFDLDTTGIHMQPVPVDILIQHLRDGERHRLHSGNGLVRMSRPEGYLVSALMDFDDISYDDHADLLYKLAGQVVSRLRSYLPDEMDVVNVLQYNQKLLADLIHAQMQAHFFERATEYEVTVRKGFIHLRPNSYSAQVGEGVKNFRTPVEEKKYISGMVFGGFRRCLYPSQKFDSDAERRFAVVCESDDAVEKWFKPGKGRFQIHYRHDESYEPDFVVETKTAKYLCEPKRADQMKDEEVLDKAKAAVKWCEHATDHELQHGGKPWSYLLIPHDAIQENKTITGLAASYMWKG